LVGHKYRETTEEIVNEFRNTGGFDIIGTGRTKLVKKEQFDEGLKILKKLQIEALVIIGGDDSNTNACLLAEYYSGIKAGVSVIGVPKTIDGDLKNEMIETSFGFDTATKVYSNLIGNIARDARSSQKYWHFIKLMGRLASHIALECALQTQPNICLISEEIAGKKETLKEIVDYIAHVVALRASGDKSYGVVLIPEGIIEFIPEMKVLTRELNGILEKGSDGEKEYKSLVSENRRLEYLAGKLSRKSSDLFRILPEGIAKQLTADRDPHGNVQVSIIQTEILLAEMVKTRLEEMKNAGLYNGIFHSQTHFLGYEGRCAAPSGFDANYSYTLGFTASALAVNKMNGYMAIVNNLSAESVNWIPGGIPLSSLMNFESRDGDFIPVIRKSLVDLNGKPFQEFASQREKWSKNDSYLYPDTVQYYGPAEITMQITETLRFEKK
jgi:diphosphate-dependent phosphofructokinase